MNSSILTPIELNAGVSEKLESGGYRRIDGSRLESLGPGRGRFYEDAFGVVSVVVYETWAELADSWSEDQGRLVDLMSRYMSRSDAKAWDGYLVLLCPGSPPAQETPGVERIRTDVTRVRKLVAVGDELESLSDLERLILPLLPLEPEGGVETIDSTLDLLPGLLEKHGIGDGEVRALLAAFREQQQLMEALHGTGEGS